MSIKKELNQNLSNDEMELENKTHSGKTSNGSLHNDKSTTSSGHSTPNESFHRERGKRHTRWASLRNAIKVTSVVKKPVSSKKKGSMTRQDSFLKRFSTRQHYRTDSEESLDTEDETPDVVYVNNDVTVFKPDDSPMFYWLLVVTVAVLYNLWTCIVRQAFRELQTDHKYMWITLDVVCDVIYMLDIIAQLRTGYLEQGLMVLDAVKLAKRYVTSVNFKVDILSLLPLDFLQFAIGWQPLLRFPRFLKVYRSLRWLYMLETRTAYPNFVRVANLTHMLFLGCHWFAAFYFMISEAEGFHSEWSYPKPSGSHQALTRKYLASLFWSTLTLTTIGDLPAPETNWEYVFVIGSYLIGVFIFATIVGQVGNVITNRNASRLEFERLLDGAKLYMRMHNVPAPVQRRVQRWYDYVWTRGRMTGSDINSLGLLPDKLKTELAIHVNLETLRKVTIFNECQPEFLHDLVLKMKDYIFTPGDLICRRGEVAREMFIIADGVVEVISESGSVLTQMGTGNFFGEIGILNLDGGINRRTADVKSVGYSELFVLSREDVLNALKDHPDAQEIIRKYAEQRLKQVLQERKKLQATRSAESAISHLIVCPPTSFLPPGLRKASEAFSNNIRRRKSEPSKYLDKIIQATKSKSKYRVGSSSDTEPSTVCDETKMQSDVGLDIPSFTVQRERNPLKKSKENSDVQKDTSDKFSDIIAGVRSQEQSPNTRERRHSSNDDVSSVCCSVNPLVSSNTDVTGTNEGKRKRAPVPDDCSSDLASITDDGSSEPEKCCRCGQLEAKLGLIEKQLVSVEKLYLEGIKQLETFNGINEKYIQMLSMFPESDVEDSDDDKCAKKSSRPSTIIESTKL